MSPGARSLLERWLPFMAWFPMSARGLRADLLVGVTVALILVPQSMAYAQLAGLPVVYGLYAAFIPVIVSSLWGSMRQLHTGPTALLSLMSAAALIPLATVGSEAFIALSIMLALMVGVLRLAMGLLRLGLVVNFLSHPVVIGFTNAAALIIGLSQLNKLINVPMPRRAFFLGDLWVVLQQMGSTHWPTLVFGLGAFAIIYGMQKLAPRWPGVLIAMVFTTALSFAIDFERTTHAPTSAIQDEVLRTQIERFAELGRQIKDKDEAQARLKARQAELTDGGEAALLEQLDVKAQIDRLQAWGRLMRQEQARLRVQLHRVELSAKVHADGTPYFVTARSPQDTAQREPAAGPYWRFSALRGEQVVLSGGGEVVGHVPAGLPGFSLPVIDWKLLLPLLPAALIMSLLGFMEATSISKAIAYKTKQRVDTNRELVGQGLANIVGSFFQSYVVSGSFSRSAVAAREGAQTGLFAIVSALVVVAVMLWLTDLLYHLPQAVLAMVIMFAVFGLIRIRTMVQAWKVNRLDALRGWATFAASLAMAPALANGIVVGVALAVLLYLLRNMRPRAEILGFHPDGALGGIDSHGLAPISQRYVVMRFDGSLNFVNVACFEDSVLKALARFPEAKAMLIIGNGINDIDASGADALRALAQRLDEAGVSLHFSSLKRQVMAVFEGPELSAAIPPQRIFKTKTMALQAMRERFAAAAA